MALTEKEIKHFAEQLPEGTKVVDGRSWLPEKEDEYAAWRFVEEFYPNYYDCDEIAYNNALGMVANGTFENSDAAICLRDDIIEESEFEFHPLKYDESEEYREQVRLTVESRLAESDATIYKKAIEGFIESMKGGNNE